MLQRKPMKEVTQSAKGQWLTCLHRRMHPMLIAEGWEGQPPAVQASKMHLVPRSHSSSGDACAALSPVHTGRSCPLKVSAASAASQPQQPRRPWKTQRRTSPVCTAVETVCQCTINQGGCTVALGAANCCRCCAAHEEPLRCSSEKHGQLIVCKGKREDMLDAMLDAGDVPVWRGGCAGKLGRHSATEKLFYVRSISS